MLEYKNDNPPFTVIFTLLKEEPDLIQFTREVTNMVRDIDRNLKPGEQHPLIANVIDFRELDVSQNLIDEILSVKGSLAQNEQLVNDFQTLLSYKGGYLTFILADVTLEDLKDSLDAQPANPKYQLLLSIYGILSSARIGGGFAKEFDAGSDSVIEQLKRHPLYKMRDKRIRPSKGKKKSLV